MSEVTDLEITASIRRELSGRRIDLSKVKFKVASGEVFFTGELGFVGLDKSPDEIAVEIKFIEGRLKGIKGVKALKYQFDNWLHSESGKWEPKGGVSGKPGSGASLPSGTALTCPSCSTVVKFCPCCGQPLIAGEITGKMPFRSGLKLPPKGPGVSRLPISRPMGQLKPVKSDVSAPLGGRLPGSGGPAVHAPGVADGDSSPQASVPPVLQPMALKEGEGKPPLSAKPLTAFSPGPQDGSAKTNPSLAGVGSGPAAPGRQPSGGTFPPAGKATPLSPAGSLPLVTPKTLPVKGAPPVTTPPRPVAPLTTKAPVAPPEAGKPKSVDATIDLLAEFEKEPPLQAPPKLAEKPKLAVVSPSAKEKTESSVPDLSDLSFDDLDLPGESKKKPVAEAKPADDTDEIPLPPIKAKAPVAPPPGIPDVTLDEETPLPPMKGQVPAPAKPSVQASSVVDEDIPLPPMKPKIPAKVAPPLDMSLDEETPLPPMKAASPGASKPPAGPPKSKMPIPDISFDDDVALPPLKTAAAPAAKPAPAAFPDISLDDDTPLPPMKGKSEPAPKASAKGASPAGKSENPFMPLLNEGGGATAPAKPAAKAGSGKDKESLDDILNLEFGIPDIFQSGGASAGGATAKSPASPPSASGKAAPKAGAKGDFLNLDDILDLGDLPSLGAKKADPKKDKPEKDKGGDKSDPLDLGDFDITKFKI